MENKKIKIAIDALGGDHAPSSVLEGVKNFLKDYQDVEFEIYGPKDIILKNLKETEKVKIIEAKEQMDMSVKDVSLLLRKENDIPLFKMMESSKKYDALVSAGPTQAITAGSHFLVGRITKVRRVAIALIIPNFSGDKKILLDSGANVSLQAEQLAQLANFGAIYYKALYGGDKPKVALLNIGEEETKGRDIEINTYKLLKEIEDINFIGNVEPTEAFNGSANIIVSDGFIGNIYFKTLEAFYAGVKGFTKEMMKKSFKFKLGLLFMKKPLKKMQKQLSPKEVGGGIILGCKKIVVKAHGKSDEKAYYNGIKLAYKLAKENVIEKIERII